MDKDTSEAIRETLAMEDFIHSQPHKRGENKDSQNTGPSRSMASTMDRLWWPLAHSPSSLPSTTGI